MKPSILYLRRTASVWVVIGLLATTTPSISLLHAAPTDKNAPKLTIEPAELSLAGKSARQQVAVSLETADGSVRDVTGECVFEIRDSAIARVNSMGLATPVADGRSVLVAAWKNQTVEAPVVVKNARVERPASYRLDVVPLMSKTGCNQGTCHGNLHGKGGFKLSLRGDDPIYDLAIITRDALGRRIDRNDAANSLFVRKPVGATPHEGGKRFASGSDEAKIVEAWIASGATDDVAKAPHVVRLTVFPKRRIVSFPGRQQQLVVMAELSDGTKRDVTRQASYDSSEPTKAEISADGRVETDDPIEVTVGVRFAGARGVSRLAFLADRPNFAWQDYPVNNFVDRHVLAKLKSVRVHPSEPASDAIFLRRAYLSAIGVLPTAEEAKAFLADQNPNKRNELVDRLLQRPEFNDFWTLKWEDVLRNEEKTMGSVGIWVFHAWLRQQIAADAPLAETVRKLVSTTGSTWENPAASFYRTNREPTTAVESVGQVFLGFRLQCAKCHNHPFDTWTQDDYYGLAAYFANIDRKVVDEKRKDKFDKHEINGDVVISLNGKAEIRQPTSGEMMAPTPLGGESLKLKKGDESLERLADWLTTNPQFARNFANRIWFHLMGRGIVDPPDDFRDSNAPSNPELLDELAAEFMKNGTRLRPLVATIMKSQAFQRSAVPGKTNVDDEANFARYLVRPVTAEVLLDSLCQATEVPEPLPKAFDTLKQPPSDKVKTLFESIKNPKDKLVSLRAVQLPGTKMGGSFLTVFGKPNRLLSCECERAEGTNLAQSLQMINGPSVRSKIESDKNRVARLFKEMKSDDAIVDELYLASLSRYPTPEEKSAILAAARSYPDRRAGFEDLLWVLFNSKEFLLKY